MDFRFIRFLSLFVVFVANCTSKENDKYKPLFFTVASEKTDGYNRFMRSAEHYGLKINTLGMDEAWKGGDMNYQGGGYKVNLLKEALRPYVESGDDDYIVVFTDSYDVIFLSEWETIFEKFQESKSKILFSAENFCWPNEQLKTKYPSMEGIGQKYLNSGMYIGFIRNIWNVINFQPIKNDDDDQLFFTEAYLDDEFRKENSFKLDHKSNLFQNLNGNIDDVAVSFDSEGFSNLLNKKYVKNPAVLHGNGPSKLALNNFGNYLAGAYHNGECVSCYENQIPKEQHKSFTILIAVFVEQATPFLEEFWDKIFALSYPKEQIHLWVHNSVEYHSTLINQIGDHEQVKKYLSFRSLNYGDNSMKESDARHLALSECYKKDCDFLFVVDSDAHIDNADTLGDLITVNRSFVAPLLSRTEGVWSNFWGAISDRGFYARSSDYLSIVKNEIRGVWNVPYISSCYLIKSSAFKKISYQHTELDPDMAFAKHLRSLGIFMFVSNLDDYGHLINTDAFDIKKTRPDFYEFATNSLDWEKRYIHSEYYQQLLPEAVAKQPCPDVYWFPIATDIFCQSLIDIMEAFGKWSDGSNNDKRLEGGYEAVPTRDIHMNQVNLERIWLHFLQKYVKPLQEKVFIGYFHDPPRSLMNFVVRYKPDEQPFLRPHHDSSTYTINIALNRAGIDYEGGGCKFLRYNCSITDTERGWMLMHPGRLTHFHEGLTVTKGTRYIMISFIDP